MGEAGRDPYDAWAAGEGVPAAEGACVDLLAQPTAPWPRFDCDGALIHLAGRGGLVAALLVDVGPGGACAPQRMLAEAVAWVLAGHGSTTTATPDGRRNVEWGPGSLFALARNSSWRHFNASGRERARLAVVHDLPAMLNLFGDPAFVFDNPHGFPARAEAAARRHTMDADFVADLARLAPAAGEDDGIRLALGGGALQAQLGPRPAGGHVFPIAGGGVTLTADGRRIDWRPGIVFADDRGARHQPAGGTARLLSVGLSFTAS
ncbi:MAG: hypothetical protein AB7K86_07410 [Rhodospirillales bacterium]